MFLDVIADTYIVASTPLKDVKNCVEFGGDLFSIKVIGNNILN